MGRETDLVSGGSGLEREARSAVAEVGAPLSVGTTWGISGGVTVLVTRAADEHGVLKCGGAVLTPQRPPACSTVQGGSGSIRLGERFADPMSGLEVVCTRAGDGLLTFAGRSMLRCPKHESWRTRLAHRKDGGE